MTTPITVSKKYVGINGEIKTLVIKASNTPKTSFVYDTNTDATDGRGTEFSEIFDATYVTSTGSEHVNCTFVQSTGIVTIGTVTTATTEGYLQIKGK